MYTSYKKKNTIYGATAPRLMSQAYSDSTWSLSKIVFLHTGQHPVFTSSCTMHLVPLHQHRQLIARKAGKNSRSAEDVTTHCGHRRSARVLLADPAVPQRRALPRVLRELRRPRFRRRHRMYKKATNTARSTTMATPTPMPARAPLLRVSSFLPPLSEEEGGVESEGLEV